VKRRVVVTGLGVVAPNGVGKKNFSDAIFSGKSGIKDITSIDTTNLKVKIAGEVTNFDPCDYIPIHIYRKSDRFVHLGLSATKLAIDDANISADSHFLKNAFVVIGSGQGGLMFHEQEIIKFVESQGTKRLSASAVPRITANAISAYIAIQYSIRGLNQVISTACSSGAQAIGNAFHHIQRGSCDVAITGGVESTITPVMLELYNAMMVLGSSPDGDPQKASRPFDLNRNGFIMGEGAATLILESLEHALQRKAPIHAEIVGFGSNCGAYNMVAPNPTGEDAAEAILEAMREANLSSSDIDYINAHGTSTKLNDISETKAIKLALGELSKKIPISSIKSMIGHSIGASGAIEAVASCLAIQENMIPPTINLHTPDPECDLDYVPNQARCQKVDVVMSNSFGFGSNNAVLIFRRIKQ
jgi:3-oxoacyl-[acyl-carrier-protein] synthase II